MPVDIKAECESIGLHPFRAAEMQLLEETKDTGVLVYDTERTVETMVNNIPSWTITFTLWKCT